MSLEVGRDELRWRSASGPRAYDVIRGDLAVLRASTGAFAVATTDGVSDQAGWSLPHTDLPAPGEGFWYLVRAAGPDAPGSCVSGGPAQSGERDVEIAASGVACP